jgi:hypothetical protein
VDLVAPTSSETALTGHIVTTDVTAASLLSDYTDTVSGFRGTSSATALAAGIGGLVLSLNPALTQRDVRNILQHSAVKISTLVGTYDSQGFNAQAGHGRVDAHRAVVPVVKIKTSKILVQVDEPFDITVSASAPHLLSEIGWSRGVGTCPAGIEQWRPVDGKAFHEETWTGLKLTSPGVYRFYPNAKDSLWPAIDGYPHIASDAFPKLEEVVIEVQGSGTPAAGCTTPMPPTNLSVEQ